MRVAISEALSVTGLSRAIGLRYRGRGLVFMMHSVVEDAANYLYQPIRCAADRLERALWWVRDNDLDIVTLDEALLRLRDPDSRPFVVFTFDDGYRDNLEVALPLMERYDAPMTIFVTTHMVTRELYGWWLALVPLIRDNPAVDVDVMNKRFDTADMRSKRAAIKEIGNWVHEDGKRAASLGSTFSAYGIDVEALIDAEAMTTAELKWAGRHPLVTIGGHTTSHCFLNLQPRDVVQKEIRENKKFLEDIIDQDIAHFAYPYGAAGQREFDIARDIGFKTAVTTKSGTLFPEHAQRNTVFAIPRETLDQHDTNGCLDCRYQGVYRFLKSRGGSPVATA